MIEIFNQYQGTFRSYLIKLNDFFLTVITTSLDYACVCVCSCVYVCVCVCVSRQREFQDRTMHCESKLNEVNLSCTPPLSLVRMRMSFYL